MTQRNDSQESRRKLGSLGSLAQRLVGKKSIRQSGDASPSGASSPFGSSSPIGVPPALGTSSQLGAPVAFGTSSQMGVPPALGASAPIGPPPALGALSPGSNPGAFGSSPSFGEQLAELSHRLHQSLSLAEDAATSNRALLQISQDLVQTAGQGGFAAVTQQLVDTTEELHDHVARIVKGINDAVASIGTLEDSIAALDQSFTNLRERVDGVQRAAGTIHGIAEQSHVLSLNARIEATRAGREAAGFNVVAQEIGKLAHKTQSMSEEIDGDVRAIGLTMEEFSGRFSLNRRSMLEATRALKVLDTSAHGIGEEADKLATVTGNVERLAHIQVSIQQGLDRVARHSEWVEQAAAPLISELGRNSRDLDGMHRQTAAPEEQRRFDTAQRFGISILRAMERDDPEGARGMVQAALRDGAPATTLLRQVSRASARYYMRLKEDEPLETYYRNGQILRGLIEELEPAIPPAIYEGQPIVVLGNAYEDHHDLGRRLVALAMRSSGFKVIDLGLSVRNEDFVRTAVQEGAHVVGVSSLLLHTAKWIPDLKAALVAKGRKDIGVIAGGAPFIVDPMLRQRFGADGVGRNPVEAVRLVRAWVADHAHVGVGI